MVYPVAAALLPDVLAPMTPLLTASRANWARASGSVGLSKSTERIPSLCWHLGQLRSVAIELAGS